MMASSQVEIATTSPFGGCSAHNRRDHCFQNNINNLVIPNDNSRPVDLTDLWVHRPQWQTPLDTSNNNNSDDNCSTRINDKCNANNTDTRSGKDNWARAREMVFYIDDGSGLKSKNSEEVPSLGGVSSLVQKWRGFEAGAKCCSCKGNSGTASQPDTANSAAVSNYQDNSNSVSTENNVNSASTENAGPESPVPATTDDDPFGDWESDKTTMSRPSSSLGRNSDAAESERLRVVDIIRKLTEDRLPHDVFSDSSPRVKTPSEQSESRLSLSPRKMIRGRQAYNDLLMQMERDRRKELEGLVGRKAVSAFSHRGRIQALLRVGFLRRGMEAKESYGLLNNTSSDQSYKVVQSAIEQFRERINIPSAQNGSVPSGSCRKEVTDNNPSGPKQSQCQEVSKERTNTSSKSCTVNQKSKENQCPEVLTKDCKPTSPNSCAANQKEKEYECQEATNSKNCLIVKKDNIQVSEGSKTSKEHDVDENMKENACPSSTCIMQEANMESRNNSLAKFADQTIHNIEINSSETTKAIVDIQMNGQNKEEDANINHQITKTNYDLRVDISQSESNQDLVESDAYWVSDVSHPEIGWEEMHSDYQQEEESHRDWIDEVSRPRSDWEGLRQARYQEMLDPFLENEEIRTLLGRSCVSTFLSSSLREKIDQLMVTRTQGPQIPKNNQEQEQKHDQILPELEQADLSEREDEQLDEGGDSGNYYDEYEEAESSVGQQYNYNKSDDYTDQITSSLTAASSSLQNQRHEELIDHSYQDLSPSDTQQSPSNYYSQENGTCSFNAHPAIEMELMYELRRHMEQLHQEMSELRKSIKCCMDMQIKLQRSIKEEVAMAVNRSDGNNGRRNPVGRCHVCCKTQVD